MGHSAADGELHRQRKDEPANDQTTTGHSMEVRGNHQHRFELLELSRRLGGYSIVIDETVPPGEVHAITETTVHVVGSKTPYSRMRQLQIFKLQRAA